LGFAWLTVFGCRGRTWLAKADPSYVFFLPHDSVHLLSSALEPSVHDHR